MVDGVNETSTYKGRKQVTYMCRKVEQMDQYKRQMIRDQLSPINAGHLNVNKIDYHPETQGKEQSVTKVFGETTKLSE